MTRHEGQKNPMSPRTLFLAAALAGLCAAPALAGQAASVVSKEAGPIWSNADANSKCPRLCAPPSKWNGQWRTTVPNKMSTCDCETPPPPPPAVVSKEAGPIWSNADANSKCPQVCAPTKWNGQWRTTVPNKMSTCDCAVPAPVVVSKDAGPIWSNADANNKCPQVCAPTKWNGQWRTTVPNKMSTCDCESSGP